MCSCLVITDYLGYRAEGDPAGAEPGYVGERELTDELCLGRVLLLRKLYILHITYM